MVRGLLASNAAASNDWLDYTAAFGGLVGGIAAVVALVLAWLSRDEAQRSADAAERTAKAAEASAMHSRTAAETLRLEHEAAKAERAKRPRLTLDVWWDLQALPFGNQSILLHVVNGNAGELDADRVLRVVLVPERIPIRRSAEGGGIAPAGPIQNAMEAFEDGGDPLDWHYPWDYVDLIAGGGEVVFYQLDLAREGEGTFPVIVRLSHVSAPGGQVEVRGYIDPAQGKGHLGKAGMTES